MSVLLSQSRKIFMKKDQQSNNLLGFLITVYLRNQTRADGKKAEGCYLRYSNCLKQKHIYLLKNNQLTSFRSKITIKNNNGRIMNSDNNNNK